MRKFATGELDVRGSGMAWAVYVGAERLTRFYAGRPTALLAANRLEEAGRTTTRPCLCCGHDFESEGKHNRMCRSCRQLAAGIA